MARTSMKRDLAKLRAKARAVNAAMRSLAKKRQAANTLFAALVTRHGLKVRRMVKLHRAPGRRRASMIPGGRPDWMAPGRDPCDACIFSWEVRDDQGNGFYCQLVGCTKSLDGKTAKCTYRCVPVSGGGGEL